MATIDKIDVEIVPQATEVQTLDNDIKVSQHRREFNIIGDGAYIGTASGDAPQWLIDATVNSTREGLQPDIDSINDAIDSMADDLLDTKTGFAQRINTIETTHMSAAAVATAIQAKHEEVLASIGQISATYASKDYANAVAANKLETELVSGGAISNAIATQVTAAVTTPLAAVSTSVQELASVLTGEVEGRAEAIDTINTYVGINGAGASTGTGLSAYFEGSDGTIGGADSKVVNGVVVDSTGTVSSKWNYNSKLVIDGVAYNSGFGINSTGVPTGTSVTIGNTSYPVYNSEFWINANKFRFTSATGTSNTDVFTINGTDVSFNGNVSINSIKDGTSSAKIGVFKGKLASAPSTANEGDTYYNTSTSPGVMMYYNGTAWVSTKGDNGGRGPGWFSATTTVSPIGTWAIGGTNDLRARTITGNPPVEGDIVTLTYDGISQAQKWNGSAWQAPGLYLNGDMIVEGSIDADRINATTIAASNLLVDQTIKSSSFTTIGGPGFRLKSNATGGVGGEDPTIYGAYIKGGTVDGALFKTQVFDMSKLRMTNSLVTTNTAPAQVLLTSTNYPGPSTVINALTLYGANYTSGYSNRRCISSAQKIHLHARVVRSNSTVNYLTAYYRVNGGGWTYLTRTYAWAPPNNYPDAEINTWIVLDMTSINTVEFSFSWTGEGSQYSASFIVQTFNLSND